MFQNPLWQFVDQIELNTQRLHFESITEVHANELVEFFADPVLHTFVPFDPPGIHQQKDRCIRWSKRWSPDRTEIWLNWAARDKETKQIAAHIQTTIKLNRAILNSAELNTENLNDDLVLETSIGYVVGQAFQKKGYATECLVALFEYLHNVLCINELKAYIDTRNLASQKLVQKMGMKQVDFIKGADFFKDASSDEFVYSIKF